ncbi:peptidase inhibitor family I36 protein [Actinokineospora enzanensis]|uniref:peptidase inhibitor family I36 protein n=1 Tax=Actinokineospora enzanensis TaxID=155975 RepID=UPI0003826F27|nr:peptidase inhibitor family I36 protein [Actinokineospora enzanensis]
MRKKTFLALLLALASALGLSSTPASAGTGLDSAGAGLCEQGELCLWEADGFRGSVDRLTLADTVPGECVVLAGDTRSFANLMSRDVTVYQSEECSTEGDFTTYPGSGTWVPRAPFLVRAVQLWPITE